MLDQNTADEIRAILSDPASRMTLEMIEVARLEPYGRLARRHPKKQIDLLVKAIDTNGCLVPAIVDEDYKLLAGVARHVAAKRLGLTHIPVVVVRHLTEARKREFILFDNRVAEEASWDNEVLKVELQELLIELPDVQIELTGFEGPQIDTILHSRAEGPDPGDACPALGAQPVTRLGDVWRLGEHLIACADSTDPTILEALDCQGAVKAVFTDPPYNVKIGGHVTRNLGHGEFVMASGEMSDEAFTEFLIRSFQVLITALAPGGLAYVCMDWRHIDNVSLAAKATRLDLLNLIVWDKKLGGMGSLYRSRHELIFLFKKPGAPHENRVKLGSNGRDRANVWAYEGMSGFGADKAKAREMHATVKPTALVRDALLDCTGRGDLVLDLFSGSGTTLIAAEQTGRIARVVELDPKYVDVAVQRWQALTGRPAMLEQSGESFSRVAASRAAEDQSAKSLALVEAA